MASTGRVIKMFVKARDCAGPAKLGLWREPRRAAGRSDPFASSQVITRRLCGPGDCPFCHKVMLVAALRNASFETVLVDLKDKPASCARPLAPRPRPPEARPGAVQNCAP